MVMKLLFSTFLVIVLAKTTSAIRKVSSNELKQIIRQRSLAGIWYQPPSALHRAAPEPQIDCALRVYTGRFWLIDEYLQSINNVPSFYTCIKKCYQYNGCKAVNYVQEMNYCELESYGFVDDPEQEKGTLGELVDLKEAGHADIISCKEIPPGLIDSSTPDPSQETTGPPSPEETSVPTTAAVTTVGDTTTPIATTPEATTLPTTVADTTTPATTVPTTTELITTTLQPTTLPTTLPTTSAPTDPPQVLIPEMFACGRPRYPPRISKDMSDPSLYGTEPAPHSWPWVVNIFYQNQHRCTGSLLRVNARQQQSDIVMTAASCLVSNNGASLPVSGMRILLGSHRANQPAPGQVTAGVISFIQMPQYNSTYFQKDVALIKLDRPVKFSTTILPACLAKAGDVFTVDRLCAVTGWGNKPENSPAEAYLVQLRVSPYSATYCASQTVCRVSINNIPCFCGGLVTGIGPAKNIDAGSPLTCLIDGNWQQMGIAATINEMLCLTSDSFAPNVFVRVAYIRDWIDSSIAKLTSVPN